jgi:hypothetical protein
VTANTGVGERFKFPDRYHGNRGLEMRDAIARFRVVLGGHRRENAPGQACIENFGHLETDGAKAGNRDARRLKAAIFQDIGHPSALSCSKAGAGNSDA